MVKQRERNGKIMPQQFKKQDDQALLKAEHCPRVAAALCIHKNTKKAHVTLTFDLRG